MKYNNGLITTSKNQLNLFFLLIFILTNKCGSTVFSNSLQICLEHCVDRNLAIPLASGSLRWRSAAFLECDYQCHIDSCKIGCKDLEQLDSTCDNRCSSTKAIDSCFQGCYAVSNIFLHQIQYLLNHVTVEAKLDPLRGAILSWTFGESFGITLQEISAANIQWHAQTRSHQSLLKSGSGWKWTEFPPGSFKETSTNVTVVVPLEEIPDYEIRLAAIWRDKTIVSQIFFQTIPGISVKSKPPQLLTNMQISSNKFLICWHSDPPVGNTEGGSYNIELKNESDGSVADSFETNSQCHLFHHPTLVNSEYPINLKVYIWEKRETNNEDKMVTIVDSKDKLEINVTLEEKLNENHSTENTTLIFTNGTAILKMADLNDFLMLGDLDIIPFSLNDNQKISALATVSHDQLIIGLSDGSIYSLKVMPPPPIDDETIIDLAFNGTENTTPKFKTEQSLIRESDGIEIIQLVVDGIQERIYAVRNQSGLIRCSFNNCQNATVLTTNSISYIERIAVDSWNGFLYYSTANGDVFIATLFPWQAPSTYSFNIQRRIAQIPQIYSMEIDYVNLQLIAALKNGTLIGMNLINQNVTNLRPALLESEKYGSVKKQKFINERLFWISSECGDDHEWKSCLYGEEKDPDTGVIHLNRYLYGGPVSDIAILQDLPNPAYLLPPEKVSLIISGKEAKATWLPPISLPFQASGTSWRNLKYDFKLIESSTSTVLDHNQTSENEALLNAKISKATNYTIYVKICIEKNDDDSYHFCSKPISTSVMTPGLFSTIPIFPSVVAYVPTSEAGVGGSLKMIDILGHDFNNTDNSFPLIPSKPPDVISFDNATKALYFADASDISIFRSMSPLTIRYRFIDFLTITHISIIPSKAVIVFSSAYQIVQYRLTGTFDRMVYQCGQQDCSEVVAVTACDNDSKIYYLLQSPNGNISLFEFHIDNFVSVQISSVKQFPKIKQLIYTENEFTFITFDGQIGTFDANLQNIQINYGLKNVKHLLPYIPIESKAVEFVDEKIEANKEHPMSAKLDWAINASSLNSDEMIIYKIQLFKDRFGGERIVDITLKNQYTIPSTLLEKWPSQQKYDIIVDAITPWNIVTINSTELTAPTKPPTAPKNLKLFVTQQKTTDGARAIIDLFWDKPDEWNGEMLEYIVNCSIIDGNLKSTVFVQNVSAKASPTCSFSVKSGKVSCAVAASNEQNLIGKYSDTVSIDSSDKLKFYVRPLVRLFAIDSTDNLVAISNWSTIWDGVRVFKRESSSQNPKYQGMAFVDNNLYAIRKEDSVQPFAVMLDVNNVQNVLHKVQLNTEFSQIEAVTSDWVANRLLFVAGHDIFQIVLDTFDSLSVATPQKVFSLSTGAQDAKQLLFDPFSNSAYLLTTNGSLFRLDLNHGTEQNLALSLECLKSQTITSIMTDFKWNRAASPMIYALTWNGIIAIDTNTNSKCTDIQIQWDKFGEKGIKSVQTISIADKLFVFGTATDLIIYDRNTETLSTLPMQNTPLKQILAVSQSSQPYPERTCFQLPAPETIQFNVTNEGRTGALVSVKEPIPSSSCANISFPPTQYDVHFRRAKTDKVKHFRSISNNIHIENGILDKETDYDVYLSWFNRYYTYKDQISDFKSLKTGYGYPTSPRDPAAFALSPDTVLLYWKLPQSLNAPREEIKYRITQQSSSLASPVSIGAKQFENGTFSTALSDIVSCIEDPCQAKIANLRPSADYKFWITAIHFTRLQATFAEDDAVSMEAVTRTMDIPGTLRLDNVTSESLMLRWNSLDPQTLPEKVDVQYRLSGTDATWTSSPNSTFDPKSESSLNITIPSLRSSTSYDYRFVAIYSGKYSYSEKEKTFTEQFYQPTQQGRTKAGTPSAPISVEITKERAFWILKWQQPENDGGAPIVSYAVEYRPNKTAEWEIAERGLSSDRLWWRIDKPSAYSPQSQFRVRAANSEGFGPYGMTKEIEIEKEKSSTAYYFILWISIIIVLTILTLCIAGLFIIRKNKKKEKLRKIKMNEVIGMEYLSNLNSNSFSELTKPFQNELRNLPDVSRECVKILDKIGHGSFGDVYRGDAWNLPMVGSKRVPVAIKTLKEGNSSEDRIKFVKEAILMNNFDHPNIVKLLGVCFDSEPHLLLIELMEGGDLLKFLRSCRPMDTAPSQLSLNEIFSIMIDVGRGCAYLEMNKHVHRDLAARNCLITSRSSSMRVTKIADFGLARHMYINDYYRVKGEDFLPLRWLAPESAMDGVFTTKSDVWAYGVLCWETLTLGEQPYDGKVNSQVLPFIRSGGRLEKPNECPTELYEIIHSCWQENPENRPSFSKLLAMIETLHNNPEMRSNHPFPLIQSGFINNGFDASQDSNISQHYPHQHQLHRRNQSSDLIGGGNSNNGRFDKSDNVRHSGLPSHLRSRVIPTNSNVFSFDRPESSISGQTEITTLGEDNGGFSDDYEIPRNSHPPTATATLSSIISVNPENFQSTDSQNSKKSAAKVSRV